MEIDFTSGLSFSEIDSGNNFFILKVVFNEALKVGVIFTSLSLWNLFEESSNICVFVLHSEKVLLDNWELHVFLVDDFPNSRSRIKVEVKS